MNLCDLKTIKNILTAFKVRLKKEYGQNFLTDRSVVEDIADNCCFDPESVILEIGPGIGVLTYELALRFKKVVALEIDDTLMPILKYTLGDFDNVEVLNQDVMKTELDSLLSPYFASGKVSVCANLPYYITTPILMKLLESRLPFETVTVMVQEEVADRLCAEAGRSDYGAITAALGYYGTAQKLFTVPADRFVPAPKVNSAVVRIVLHRQCPYHPKDEAMMFRTIKAAFEQRRKTLSNALTNGFPELTKEQIGKVIEGLGHRPDIRGEKLSTAQFADLSDALSDAIEASR